MVKTCFVLSFCVFSFFAIVVLFFFFFCLFFFLVEFKWKALTINKILIFNGSEGKYVFETLDKLDSQDLRQKLTIIIQTLGDIGLSDPRRLKKKKKPWSLQPLRLII